MTTPDAPARALEIIAEALARAGRGERRFIEAATILSALDEAGGTITFAEKAPATASPDYDAWRREAGRLLTLTDVPTPINAMRSMASRVLHLIAARRTPSPDGEADPFASVPVQPPVRTAHAHIVHHIDRTEPPAAGSGTKPKREGIYWSESQLAWLCADGRLVDPQPSPPKAEADKRQRLHMTNQRVQDWIDRQSRALFARHMRALIGNPKGFTTRTLTMLLDHFEANTGSGK